MLKKLYIIIPVAVLILVSAGWFSWIHFYQHPKATTQPQNTQGINFGPPTPEEQKSGDNVAVKKDTPVVGSQSTPQNTSQSKSTSFASVAITDANVYNNQVEVRAFVSNMSADGTCTYIFTAGSKTVTKTSPAKADISTTNCLTLDFNVAELSGSSQWAVTVKYTNQQGTATGSAQTELKI